RTQVMLRLGSNYQAMPAAAHRGTELPHQPFVHRLQMLAHPTGEVPFSAASKEFVQIVDLLAKRVPPGSDLPQFLSAIRRLLRIQWVEEYPTHRADGAPVRQGKTLAKRQ